VSSLETAAIPNSVSAGYNAEQALAGFLPVQQGTLVA